MTSVPPAAPEGAPAAKSPILSILSLVAGLVSLVCCGGVLFGAAAIVLGVLGKKREPNGNGLALAGIITGALGAVFGVILTILWVLGAVALPWGTSSYYYGF